MIPKFRACDACEARGVEKRIGTADHPMVQITIGVIEPGLSYDAKLPRWAWRLYTRFHETHVSGDDKKAGELEGVPVRHELCLGCAHGMLTAADAHEVLTQRQYRNERRVDAAQRAAKDAADRAAALAAAADAGAIDQ